jgi:hypothetical protein
MTTNYHFEVRVRLILMQSTYTKLNETKTENKHKQLNFSKKKLNIKNFCKKKCKYKYKYMRKYIWLNVRTSSTGSLPASIHPYRGHALYKLQKLENEFQVIFVLKMVSDDRKNNVNNKERRQRKRKRKRVCDTKHEK